MNQELLKIAESTTMTYLEKTASIVDMFHAGQISGEEADEVARANNIAPTDLSTVYDAAYGNGMEKTAAEESGDEMTYLDKTAAIADHVAAGDIATVESLQKIAAEHGISLDDINSIYGLAYGDELDKTAQIDEADAILADVNATYLTKTATIASLALSEVITPEQASSIATDLNISVDDVAAVVESA